MGRSRRLSRELVLQGLYEWQLAGSSPQAIEQHLAEHEGFARAHAGLFTELLHGVITQWAAMIESISPFLDRPAERLSPVERGVLAMAAFELARHPETPYRVILNEAIELTKRYGGTDGYKYVNGVLDRLAARTRAEEVARRTAPNP